MADTMDAMGSPEAGTLARTISVAGLAISQAADELQQAAERLIAAEGQARDADLRVAVAEEQVAQGASKTAELLTVLQQAKEQQLEAEDKARRSEQRLEATNERARLLEEQVQDLQARLEEADGRPDVTVIVDGERTALQEAIAAEVRRPLTSILGITLALKHTDSKSPDGREMVRQLSTHARKLDRLVGEMLDVDRIAMGTFTPNLRRTDLEALVRRVVEESSDLANRDIKVKTEHVAIQVDPALTEQIVESLLANAGRRTVPGNTVWVTVSSDPDGAVIAVDDIGPEVPDGLRQSRSFAAAVSGASAPRESARATGLALLSRLAEIHGGRTWVEDRPNGGSSFRVFLPDAASRREQELSEDEREEVAAGPDQQAAGPEQQAAGPELQIEEQHEVVRPATLPEEQDEVRIRPRRQLDERAMALARALGQPVGDEEGIAI
jgi:K+-sensing histidine kinase KdpD